MVISESTKRDLVARGIAADMIRVVHCGIDHAVYCPDGQHARYAEPTVTYVGRLKRYKSVDHVFAAARLLQTDFPSICVKVIGAGDDDGRLRRRAAELGMSDRIHFAGYVPVAQKVETLRRSWVVVCPSLKEGWGLTNIEANACGTPVVCADVPGLRDSAIDGETGLLYPHGRVDLLAGHLRRVLADATLRERLAQGGLRWAGRFHWEQAARETEQIIEQVASGERFIDRPSGARLALRGGHAS
jgi:glycosyltransferase involved in cell wall biosynthesis